MVSHNFFLPDVDAFWTLHPQEGYMFECVKLPPRDLDPAMVHPRNGQRTPVPHAFQAERDWGC